MPRLPLFITFTGADDFTDVNAMKELSKHYPIEWGVLFSPKRQGVDPRYPGGDAQSRLLWSGLTLAAHLCGDHSRAIMENRKLDIPVDLAYFKRVQINHAAPMPSEIIKFRNGWAKFRCIAQCRSIVAFPKDTSIDWLFDASGGRGLAPPGWPPYPGRIVGYAGGIGVENVLSVIEKIGASGPYWIDMESGVRTNNRFDVSLCRSVCEKVYGS